MRNKYLCLVIIFLLVPVAVVAQHERDHVKKRKVRSKELKSVETLVPLDSIKHCLMVRQWIVKIERIPGRRGVSIPVGSENSFIAVRDGVALVSLAQRASSLVDAKEGQFEVSRYQVAIGANPDCYAVEMCVNADGLDLSIVLDVNVVSRVAWVGVSGKRMRKATYIGRLIPLESSSDDQVSFVQ